MQSNLVLKNISKRFSNKTVLEPLNLEIPEGAFVALLGPSGCGKTTLLRMVAGLETPSGGEIHLGSRKLYSDGFSMPPEKRGFGMVFQSYAVWPHLSVFENVAYPLKIKKPVLSRGQMESEVNRVLKLVHLDGLETRMPHQLSGGQQQRVALARGLVMKPPLLLLDEPLSNLDARLRAQMRKEIRDLHRALGITLLYVTHDQREAFEMSTEVAVMNEGRIVQRGTPEDVRNRPEPVFVKSFLELM